MEPCASKPQREPIFCKIKKEIKMEPCASKPQREPEIHLELSRLDKAIAVLNDEICTLSSRINFVQRQEPEAESDNIKSSCVESSCELSNSIAGFSRRINSVVETIRHQIAMLEI